MLVAVRRNAVDLVIRSHHRIDVTLFHRNLEGFQEIFSNYAFRITAGRNVSSTFWLAMHGEVLRGRHYMRAIHSASTLKSPDGGQADPRGKVWIFAVSFLRASPARISCQVENRSEAVVGAARAGFGGCRGKNIFHQSRIPRR